jgi:hypothetical protein
MNPDFNWDAEWCWCIIDGSVSVGGFLLGKPLPKKHGGEENHEGQIYKYTIRGRGGVKTATVPVKSHATDIPPGCPRTSNQLLHSNHTTHVCYIDSDLREGHLWEMIYCSLLLKYLTCVVGLSCSFKSLFGGLSSSWSLTWFIYPRLDSLVW